MLFLSKDLASCKEDVNKAQNPFVVGKLDVQSIEAYDFKSYQGYIDSGERLGGGQDEEDEASGTVKEKITKKNFGRFFAKA